MPKPPSSSSSIKCLVGRTRVYLVLALVAMIGAVGASISTQFGVALGTSACAFVYTTVTLLVGDGALLLLATAVVDAAGSWVEVALVAAVSAGVLLATGFVTGGIVATLCGLALAGSGLGGLLVFGYRQHQGRLLVLSGKLRRRRTAGS